MRDLGGQRGERFVQGHRETQIRSFQSWPFGIQLPLVKERKKPSHAHTRPELMKLKCQGTSFAKDALRGPRNVFTWACVFVRFADVNHLSCNWLRALSSLSDSLSHFPSGPGEAKGLCGLAKGRLS